MIRALLTCLALLAISAHADEVRIYETDAYGHVQHHKPSYLITSQGRVLQVGPRGNKLYQKQQYQITGDKIVPVDTYGNRQYNRPAWVIDAGESAKVSRRP